MVDRSNEGLKVTATGFSLSVFFAVNVASSLPLLCPSNPFFFGKSLFFLRHREWVCTPRFALVDPVGSPEGVGNHARNNWLVDWRGNECFFFFPGRLRERKRKRQLQSIFLEFFSFFFFFFLLSLSLSLLHTSRSKTKHQRTTMKRSHFKRQGRERKKTNKPKCSSPRAAPALPGP